MVFRTYDHIEVHFLALLVRGVQGYGSCVAGVLAAAKVNSSALPPLYVGHDGVPHHYRIDNRVSGQSGFKVGVKVCMDFLSLRS